MVILWVIGGFIALPFIGKAWGTTAIEVAGAVWLVVPLFTWRRWA